MFAEPLLDKVPSFRDTGARPVGADVDEGGLTVSMLANPQPSADGSFAVVLAFDGAEISARRPEDKGSCVFT